jgi:cytochrome c2
MSSDSLTKHKQNGYRSTREINMFIRIRNALVMAVSILLFTSIHILAGGWAVITLDELPGPVRAGQPFAVGFIVRQHGHTPMGSLDPIITAQLTNSGKPLVVHAKPQGNMGHYVATLVLPKAGTWNWSIQAFSMDQPLPPLTVIAASTKTNPPTLPYLWIGLLGLVLGLIGLLISFRQGKRWAAALAVIGLILTSMAFSGAAKPASHVEGQMETNISQAELGQQLFVTKGCVTCHVNNRLANMPQYDSFNVGPNLTNLAAQPKFLQAWLADPPALKPDTQMPNLNLSEEEINALVAFLTSK